MTGADSCRREEAPGRCGSAEVDGGGRSRRGGALGRETAVAAAVFSALGACARGNEAEEVERGRAVHKGEGEV